MRVLDKQHLSLTFIFFAGICCVSLASDCIPPYGYKGCACSYSRKVNNTDFLNLLPLKIDSSSPRFTVKDNKNWYLSYSPCGVFDIFVGLNKTGDKKPCVKASVSRWTNASSYICESLGDQKNAKFVRTKVGDDGGNIKSNLTLVFRNDTDQGHGMKISLICNDAITENETIFEYINTTNNPTDTYYLALTSKCCCPGRCGIPPAVLVIPTTNPTSGNTSNSKEAWEIALIVAGGIILIVLIAVTVYCCSKKRGGYELI